MELCLRCFVIYLTDTATIVNKNTSRRSRTQTQPTHSHAAHALPRTASYGYAAISAVLLCLINYNKVCFDQNDVLIINENKLRLISIINLCLNNY